jgi:hypothetical protein
MIEKKIYILKKKGELKQVNRTLKKKGFRTRICSSGWISVRERFGTSIHNQAHEWEYIGILMGLKYSPSSKNDHASENVR